jgi:DNA-directed RNA polymerase specialized sigma24 family protein
MLLISSQDGDRVAYRNLLREIVQWLRAANEAGPAGEALISRVLLSLHVRRHTYHPGRPLRAWLLGIVRHHQRGATRPDLAGDRHLALADREAAARTPDRVGGGRHSP